MQISNRERCARCDSDCIQARGASFVRSDRPTRSLTTEDDDDDDLVLHVRLQSTRAALVSHSCVVGLRARLKPERFWFDSRGWDCRVCSKTWIAPGSYPDKTSVRIRPGPPRVTNAELLPTLTRNHRCLTAPPSRCVLVTSLCATQAQAGSTPVTCSIRDDSKSSLRSGGSEQGLACQTAQQRECVAKLDRSISPP